MHNHQDHLPSLPSSDFDVSLLPPLFSFSLVDRSASIRYEIHLWKRMSIGSGE